MINFNHFFCLIRKRQRKEKEKLKEIDDDILMGEFDHSLGMVNFILACSGLA